MHETTAQTLERVALIPVLRARNAGHCAAENQCGGADEININSRSISGIGIFTARSES